MKIILVAISLLGVLSAFGSQVIPNTQTMSSSKGFRNYSVTDGLTHNTVHTIHQDHLGFIWVGTNEGLNRFDGRNFRSHMVSRLDTISLGNHFIRSILEYRDKHILVGTEEGLYLYNMETDVFSRINSSTENKRSIDKGVTSMVCDSNGNVWIASPGDGLFCWNPVNDSLLLYQHNPHNTISISSNQVSVLYRDREGYVWAGTKDQGLNKFKPETNSFERFTVVQSPGGLACDHITSIYEDGNNRFWIGTAKGGLHLMDRNAGTFKQFVFDPGSDNQGIKAIHAIHEYNEQQLFAGTEAGLVLFNHKTGSYTIHTSNPFSSKSLSDNTIYAIHRDNEGSFWIGTRHGGLDFLPKNLKNIQHLYPENTETFQKARIIGEFAEDNDGNIWIATEDNGLFRFDRQTNAFTHLPGTNPDDPLSHHSVQSIHAANDTLWIGLFSNGIDMLDLATGVIRNYQFDKNTPRQLASKQVNKVFGDNTSTVWAGTNSGLYAYDRASDSFIAVNDPLLRGSDIHDIYQDSEGSLWAGTFGNGIFRRKPGATNWDHYLKTEKDKKSPFSNFINCIHQDQNGTLWFGSKDSRIFYYDYQDNAFYTIPFLFENLTRDAVLSLLDDEAGNLWIGTNNGLFRYNPDIDKYLYLFQYSDGFQSNQFNYRSACKASDGKLFFGGINGFNSFYPGDIKINTFAPPVVIKNLTLFNEDIQVNPEHSPLARSVLFTREVVFNHKQTVFGIEFVSLSYILPEKNRYEYMLEGRDKEWITLHNQNEVSFSNLPAGNYTFHIRASNNDGVFNENPVSLDITILPPFWKTNWAYTVYLLLVASSLFFFAWYMNNSANRRNKRKIMELNLQKEKEIANLKIDFFTNIAHEIKTPLMLINGPVERLMASHKGPAETPEEYRLINKHVNRLFNLVNQLMDFRKIDKKAHELNYAPVDAVELIRELFVSFTQLAKKKDIDFTFRSNAGYFNATLDAEVIIKVVCNLLTNAFKYTNKRIELIVHVPKETSALPDDEHSIEIVVADDGIGIDKEYHDAIFDPFYQVGANRKKKDALSGIGLGLSFARSLIESHNGKLLVVSEPDKGATFTVRIPLVKQHPGKNGLDEDKQAQLISTIEKHIIDDLSYELHHQKDDSKEIVISSGNPEILIVEDNDDLRQFLRKHFQYQYNISLAANGLQALDLLKERDFDMIISDIMMPEMDGIEFCKYVKNNFETSHIPIIIFTGKTTLDTKINSTEIGADAYVEKPFSLKYLSVLIKNVLKTRAKLKTKFSQLPFVKTSEITSSKADKRFLDTIDEIIHTNIDNPDFATEDLARANNISRSSLHKKLKAISGVTPNDYIKIIKLKKAAELIRNGDYRINEICDKVGFNTPSYFSKCFQEQFGLLPSEFAKTGV